MTGCMHCKQPVTWDDNQDRFTHTTGGADCADKPGYGASPASYRRCRATTAVHGSTRTQCQRPDGEHTDHIGRYSLDYTEYYAEPVRWSTGVEAGKP